MKPYSGTMKITLLSAAAASALLLAGCSGNTSATSSVSPSTATSATSASTATESTDIATDGPSETASTPPSSSSGTTSATTSPSASAAAPSDSGSGSAGDATDAFCLAATDWANSPSRVDLQTAIANGDTASAKAALADYAAATDGLGVTVPADAPGSLKSAVTNLSAALASAQNAGTVGEAQAQQVLAAKAPIDEYVAQTCN